jgi:hypothetical protein
MQGREWICAFEKKQPEFDALPAILTCDAIITFLARNGEKDP